MTQPRYDFRAQARDVRRALLVTAAFERKLPDGKFKNVLLSDQMRRLRAMTKGRLESRFIRFPVDAPTASETARELVRRYGIPADKAQIIARGAVPDGMFDGCNVSAAFHDAEALVALLAAKTCAPFAPAEKMARTYKRSLRRKAVDV